MVARVMASAVPDSFLRSGSSFPGQGCSAFRPILRRAGSRRMELVDVEKARGSRALVFVFEGGELEGVVFEIERRCE